MKTFICYHGSADVLGIDRAGHAAVEDARGRAWLVYEAQGDMQSLDGGTVALLAGGSHGCAIAVDAEGADDLRDYLSRQDLTVGPPGGTADDLRGLPRWALVAFLCRCARLCPEGPDPDGVFARGLEAAEASHAHAAEVSPALADAALQHFEATLRAVAGGDPAFALRPLCVAHACHTAAPGFSPLLARAALAFVVQGMLGFMPEKAPEFTRLARRLRNASIQGGWDHDMPVPADLLD